MGKVIGYMATWTTYATWLQGHKRGYVKDSITFGESEGLRQANKEAQKDRRFALTKENCELVRKAILQEAAVLEQKIYAISVSATHIHIVVGAINELIETAVARYKRAGTKTLRENGIEGTFWTKGFDKRFCFNEKELRARIEYVNRQGG
ncbi:MAG: transposase [Sedimentisphaerales bacterium]|jgi:REP element-mobilizing transposase RayT